MGRTTPFDRPGVSTYVRSTSQYGVLFDAVTAVSSLNPRRTPPVITEVRQWRWLSVFVTQGAANYLTWGKLWLGIGSTRCGPRLLLRPAERRAFVLTAELRQPAGPLAAVSSVLSLAVRLTGFALDVADFSSMDGIWCISTY